MILVELDRAEQEREITVKGIKDGIAASTKKSGRKQGQLDKMSPELEKDMYIRAAVKILKAIDKTRANWGTDCDSIVLNCTGAYHSPDHHFTMVYADFYFIEAVLKLRGNDYFMW